MNPFGFISSSTRVWAGRTAVAVAALTAVGFAHAGVSGPWTRDSRVFDQVVNNNDGTWGYQYTVKNTSFVDPMGTDDRQPIIVDWELPWFGDAGITNIMSPNNWDWSIETVGVANEDTGWEGVARWQDPNDPFYAGANSPFSNVQTVLHWYNVCWVQRRGETSSIASQSAIAVCEFEFDNAIFPDAEGNGGELGGFGFTAEFDQVAAPYQASWALLPVRTGDPAFPLGAFPNSPALQGGDRPLPEPAPLLLLALAAGIAALTGRRR